MRAMIALRDGTLAKVDVYRNGGTVTVIGQGEQHTPGGPIRAIVASQMPIAAYEWARKEAIKRMGSLAYTRIIGRLGIDDNAMRAPPLPPHLARSIPMLKG
jgi:hypothetical protein